MRRLSTSTQPISITRSPCLANSPVVSVSSTTSLGIAGDPPVGEGVGPFVLRVAGVALYPMPFHMMGSIQGVELLPQVDVLHRLLVRRLPTLAFPALDPLRDPLLHVLRVGVHAHAAAVLQRLESLD